jgi:hypothetical protein
MSACGIEQVANAVLYEGYILYPYRPSAVKNRKRFNFGVLYPSGFSEAQGGIDACSMQTECLIAAGADARLDVKVRFLQLISRLVGEFDAPLAEMPEEPSAGFRLVESLEIDGAVFAAWQEAVEREVVVTDCGVAALATKPLRREFTLTSREHYEALPNARGRVAGAFLRRQHFILGAVEISAEPAGEGHFKIRVRALNLTPFERSGTREAATERALVSAHTILAVRGGEFVSLLDPPEAAKDAAAGCTNVGTFPVLAGEPGSRDAMLSSPIILYDYPQIAPESAGNFFDGTEIDEMLALRVMTMTEDEKREMRQVDRHARELLERTESLPPEHLMKLHGALRGLRPAREDTV